MGNIRAQVAPAATTETDLYEVSSGMELIESSLTVCNRGSTDTTFSIRTALLGAAYNTAQDTYKDAELPAHATFVRTIGVTLIATDVIRVEAGNGNVTFQLYGREKAL